MNTKNKQIARRAAGLIGAAGTLVLSSGVALMVSAGPAAADGGPNDAPYWQQLPGELCEKIDAGAEEGGYTVPAEPEGRDWSKLILKKGSGNIGEENQVFHDPVAGETYTWQGFDDKQDGGWSHSILCSVPEPAEEPPAEEPPAEEPPAEQPPVVEPPVVEPPVVEPPVVEPPSTKTTIVTPTVVDAGLGDVAEQSAQQGLALATAGAALLLGAGGLGLVQLGGRRS